MVGEHGLALKRTHFAHLLEAGPRDVDAFELLSENFFSDGGRPWAVIERLRVERPLALHGTAMGLGNPDGVSEDYLARLRRLIARVEPTRVSDHLCFVGADGIHSHELLPLPHAEEAVSHVADQISRVQDALGRRILVENPSTYLRLEPAEMDEAAFVRAVVERADCDLLLDLNNVLVNAHNHGFDPERYVAAMPSARVGEYHLAGATPSGSLLIDTHVGPVPEAVLDLYRHALAHIGPRPTVVEWDTDTPDFETTAAEARRVRQIEQAHLQEMAS
jgi:hypothetical protein